MRRDARVEIRLTKAEKDAWKAAAKGCGRSLTDLLCEAIGRIHPWCPSDRKIEQARLREYARIGNNLNQIAKWANTYKHEAEALEIICALISLERELFKTNAAGHHAD